MKNTRETLEQKALDVVEEICQMGVIEKDFYMIIEDDGIHYIRNGHKIFNRQLTSKLFKIFRYYTKYNPDGDILNVSIIKDFKGVLNEGQFYIKIDNYNDKSHIVHPFVRSRVF